ncbi:hypothetical protein V2J09_004733 [Rumex salicifolius]
MSNSSSPAHPSQASTATTTAALQGTTTTTSSASSTFNSVLSIDDFNLSADLITSQDHKDEALRVMKCDLMASLNKEVKSLDEDSWMFEGPRSRINLISRPAQRPIRSQAYGRQHYLDKY